MGTRVLRYCCLYENKMIGIEIIFTIRNGMQINIENKVENLRKLGQQKKLFCPCGCGSNLFLVAGPKGLRRQHFRIERKRNIKCTFVTENEESINSRKVLKYWLDDKLKLKDDDIQSRVLVSSFSKTNHKYELTFYIKRYHIGLSFIYLDYYLKDEKIEILERIPEVNIIIYVANSFNESNSFQYPEYLKKMQKVQSYCLFIKVYDDIYVRAEMRAVAYFKDLDEQWKEVSFASGLLTEFGVNEKGDIFFKERKLTELLDQEQRLFEQEQEKIQQKRQYEEQQKRLQKQQYEEQQKKLQEQQKNEGRILREKKAILKEQKNEMYFLEHQKEKEVYELLKKATKIQGTFYSKSEMREKEWKNMIIHITKMDFNTKKARIEIQNDDQETFHIYIKNGENEVKNNTHSKLGNAGNCYMLIDLTGIDVKNVREYIIDNIIKIY